MDCSFFGVMVAKATIGLRGVWARGHGAESTPAAHCRGRRRGKRGWPFEMGGHLFAARIERGADGGYGPAMTTRISNVLSIAGSDPSGGAGIQADLKAFSALGAYGCAVITALTAQSTRGVTGVQVVPAGFVREQLNTLLDDVRIDAVKVGMIANAEIAEAIGAVLRERGLPNIVLDPVMVAKGGDRLLAEDAVAAVRELLLPLATVVTPNLPEAGELLGVDTPTDEASMESAAHRLIELGARTVLMKGGHLEGGRSDDLLLADGVVTRFEAVRIETKNTHGTGCTLSAGIAALLPQTGSVEEAVRRAKGYITGAIAHADELEVGSGHGPTHHFFGLWEVTRG